jgi:hypothetical protein
VGFTSYVVPTLIPSLIAGVIALFIVYINRATTLRTHREKLEFDKQLANLKFEFDKQVTLDRAKLERQSADRRRRQELAEELLSGFYEVRDAMKSVRSPFGHSGEGSTRTRDEKETAEEKRKKDSQFVTYERFEKHRAVISQLLGRQYRASAWFGPEIVKPFKTLAGAINSTLVSAQMLADESNFGGDNDDREFRLSLRA